MTINDMASLFEEIYVVENELHCKSGCLRCEISIETLKQLVVDVRAKFGLGVAIHINYHGVITEASGKKDWYEIRNGRVIDTCQILPYWDGLGPKYIIEEKGK